MINQMNISSTNESNQSLLVHNCHFIANETEITLNSKKAAFVVFSVLGITFNVLVIILIVKFTVRKNLHFLIVNMAITDALFLFVMLIDELPWLSDYKWSIYPDGIIGAILCKTTIFLLEIPFRVSLITLLVISIERFRATRRTLQRSRPYSRKQRIRVLCICWLIPIILAAFYANMAIKEGSSCSISLDFKESPVFGFTYIVSVNVMNVLSIVILIVSILTIRRLSQTNAIHTHISEEQRHIRNNRIQTSVRMVLVSVLAYTCCWLPFVIYVGLLVRQLIHPTVHGLIDHTVCIDWKSFVFMIRFLPVLNSCFSPCIYVIFLPDLRRASRSIMCGGDQALGTVSSWGNSIGLRPRVSSVNGSSQRCGSDEQTCHSNTA